MLDPSGLATRLGYARRRAWPAALSLLCLLGSLPPRARADPGPAPRPLPAVRPVGRTAGWTGGSVAMARTAAASDVVGPGFAPRFTLPDPGSGHDHFGSVALSGDGLTALVGAYNAAGGAGAAYVYHRFRAASPFPTQPSGTLPDPGSGQDGFGGPVALSADGLTALIGAPGTAKGASTNAGAAYIYRRANVSTPFPSRPSSTLRDPGLGQRFGLAVALSGDGLTALVNAPFAEKRGHRNAGVAYVYRRAATASAFPTRPSDILPDVDSLGSFVALSADGLTAVVGAPATLTSAGVAYAYRRAGPGSPFPAAPSDTLRDPGDSGDAFANAVALSGDGRTLLVGAVLVGAVGPATGVGTNAGAAYVYRRAGAPSPFPDQPSGILPAPVPGQDNFGESVALSSDGLTALIGAPGTYIDTTAPGPGAVYAYRRASAASPFASYPFAALPHSGARGDHFGAATALSGDGQAALVGAFDAVRGGTAGAGAAYGYGLGAVASGAPPGPSDGATPVTCSRYGYALDVPVAWHVNRTVGASAASGGCPGFGVAPQFQFTQNEDRNGIGVIPGGTKDTPRGQIGALLSATGIPISEVRYSSRTQRGTVFTVVEGTFGGKNGDGPPSKLYLLLGGAVHRGVPLLFIGMVDLFKNPYPAPQIAAVKAAFASFHFI